MSASLNFICFLAQLQYWIFSHYRYFCRSCWQFQHNRDSSLQNHKPLTRNSKSTTIVGVGPQQTTLATLQQHSQSQHNHSQYNYHQQHNTHSQHHHNHSYHGSLHSSPKSPSPPCNTSSSSNSSADSSPISCHGPANLHQQLQQQFGSL